jgi:hypothetical protein
MNYEQSLLHYKDGLNIKTVKWWVYAQHKANGNEIKD